MRAERLRPAPPAPATTGSQHLLGLEVGGQLERRRSRSTTVKPLPPVGQAGDALAFQFPEAEPLPALAARDFVQLRVAVKDARQVEHLELGDAPSGPNLASDGASSCTCSPSDSASISSPSLYSVEFG